MRAQLLLTAVLFAQTLLAQVTINKDTHPDSTNVVLNVTGEDAKAISSLIKGKNFSVELPESDKSLFRFIRCNSNSCSLMVWGNFLDLEFIEHIQSVIEQFKGKVEDDPEHEARVEELAKLIKSLSKDQRYFSAPAEFLMIIPSGKYDRALIKLLMNSNDAAVVKTQVAESEDESAHTRIDWKLKSFTITCKKMNKPTSEYPDHCGLDTIVNLK